MRIAIFGTGGAGGYFGARLARSGEDVVFIARGDHLRAIRGEGLRISSVEGDFTIRPARATDDPAEAGVVDAIFVGVKTWQVTEAARAMRPLVGPGTVVVPLQNGVEAPDQLAAVLGKEHVLVGLAKVFAFLDGPGRIRHLGGPASVTFGEIDNRPSRRAEKLRKVLIRAGIPSEAPHDVHVALWEKFLLIAPLGGVGAVTRAPVGTLRALPGTRRMLEQGMGEIVRVARAQGVPLDEEAVERTMVMLESFPANGTISLQRDIAAGRPSELEAWNGAVVRLGSRAGVPTPLHEFLYWSLLPQERRARGEEKFPE